MTILSKKPCYLATYTWILFALCWPGNSFPVEISSPVYGVQKVLAGARSLLERGNISYVWGGNQFGGKEACKKCMACLDRLKPGPKRRLAACSECKNCSLDCSHYTSLAYRLGGLKAPYMTTKTMAALDPLTLAEKYLFSEVRGGPRAALPGDLLVYRNHVVMVEKLAEQSGYGDILHATGGKDLKGPGMGIQRERMVLFESFRGPLLRVLRHQELAKEWRQKENAGVSRFRRVR